MTGVGLSEIKYRIIFLEIYGFQSDIIHIYMLALAAIELKV